MRLEGNKAVNIIYAADFYCIKHIVCETGRQLMLPGNTA